MDEIIAALRLAKERAIESENWDDLARFRDAEKIAMTTRALLFRYSDSLMEARRIIALPPPSENRWNNGFTEGGQWVLDYISVAVMAPYDDNEESDDE